MLLGADSTIYMFFGHITAILLLGATSELGAITQPCKSYIGDVLELFGSYIGDT